MALTEKVSGSPCCIRWLMMDVFPLPLGAENMISLPGMFVWCVGCCLFVRGR